ncbi:hypothetical protein G6F37_006196 [Rhizopus arrhizus]|nr:hypothetical protein G6F38_005360 [Rhizopus arrhizus]KAG1158005.1 hypothetical protein G6F37_006196 [Rhizopus arrhizus]
MLIDEEDSILYIVVSKYYLFFISHFIICKYLTEDSDSEDTGAVEISYDNSGSLWRSDGSDYVYEIDVKSSSKSTEFEKKFLWCLSMCELETIVTGKVGMITTNTTLKNLYDKAHQETKTGKSTSVGFVAQPMDFSLLTQQNINTPMSAMRSDDLLRLNNDLLTMEELAANHILADIYFRHSTTKYRQKLELSLIVNSVGCLFSTIWSSRNNIRLAWDKPSLTVITSTPSNIPIRPDIIFITKLSSGREIEISNGEIKQPNVSKPIVNATRVRVLEKAK